MRTWQRPDVTNIARPESVVMLAATVRAARELMRRERIDGLKERVSDGGYAVSSKDLAQRVLATKV
jgi:anti-sigma28 factor (negative regulator of flagellin synthesis)